MCDIIAGKYVLGCHVFRFIQGDMEDMGKLTKIFKVREREFILILIQENSIVLISVSHCCSSVLFQCELLTVCANISLANCIANNPGMWGKWQVY